jgi:hypothetical protein
MKRVFSRPLVPSALLLAAVVLLLAWTIERTASKRQAHEIWLANERVIEDAAMRRPGRLSDFEEACHFFWKLTGISVPGNFSTYLGVNLPSKDTATALVPLRRWYAENKDRLYWDKESDEVRLAPE